MANNGESVDPALLYARMTGPRERGVASDMPSPMAADPFNPGRVIFPPEIVPGRVQPPRRRKRRKAPSGSHAPQARPEPVIPDFSHRPHEIPSYQEPVTWAKGTPKAPWLRWYDPMPWLRRHLPTLPPHDREEEPPPPLPGPMDTLKYAGKALGTGGGLLLAAGGALLVGGGVLLDLAASYKSAGGLWKEFGDAFDHRSSTPAPRDPALQREFMRLALERIKAEKGHPLSKLVNPQTGDWVGRKVYTMEPAVQAGHTISRWTGVPDMLALEDAEFNTILNVGERLGIPYFKPARLIGGVPVESWTARRWEDAGIIPKGTLAKAPWTAGWHP